MTFEDVECYLPASRSGLPWLLDKESPRLQRIVEMAAADTASSSCDYASYVMDAPILKTILNDRHCGIVLGAVERRATDDVVDRWVDRLSAEKPSNRGECCGTLGHDLGLALRDAHVQVKFGRKPAGGKESQTGSKPSPKPSSS